MDILFPIYYRKINNTIIIAYKPEAPATTIIVQGIPHCHLDECIHNTWGETVHSILCMPNKKQTPNTVLCFFLLVKLLFFTYFGILLFFWECSLQQMLLYLVLIAKQGKRQQQCYSFSESQLEIGSS